MGGVTDQITAQFSGLSGTNPVSIRSAETVQMLLQTIKNFSMDAMMLPDPQIAREATYQDMALNETLRKFFVSSGSCDDFTWQGNSTFGPPFQHAHAEF